MKKIFLIVIVILTTIFGYSQNSFYVSTTGNNSNNGSLSSPWLTIQYGCNQLQAGDTLNIMAGVYQEKIDLDVSGTSTAYITIQNYLNDNVIIDAINFNDANAIIWTDNSYLRIKGLHLTNNIHNYASGLALQDVAHHIEILNNKISNIKFSSDPNAPITTNTNAVPLDIYADNSVDSIHHITIYGNEVFNNQTGYSENIAAGGNFTDFIIENNIVHDNTNIGIDIGGNYGICPVSALDHGRNGIIRDNLVYNCDSPYSTAAGIYIDGGWDIVVENNICHHNGYGGEIGCEENGTTENVIFKNNIFYHNKYAGMHIGGYDVNTTGIVLNSSVYNNTFYQNDTGQNFNGELILTKSENCNIQNNIFYLSSQNVFIYFDRTQTNLSLMHNLVFADAGSNNLEVTGALNISGLQNFYDATGYGANSIFGNPFFNDIVNNDFHITSNSVAIDAGNPAYTVSNNETDIDGQYRIYNGIIDCGADEYHPVLSVNDVYKKNIIIYPNPTNGIVYIKNVLNFSYEIYSCTGQLVKSYSSCNTIDLTTLNKGLYLVKIYNINGLNISNIKVIKE